MWIPEDPTLPVQYDLEQGADNDYFIEQRARAVELLGLAESEVKFTGPRSFFAEMNSDVWIHVVTNLDDEPLHVTIKRDAAGCNELFEQLRETFGR